jgi:hypothetical protein
LTQAVKDEEVQWQKKSVFTKLVTVFQEMAGDMSVIIIFLNSKHTQTSVITDFNTNISFMP